MKIGQIYIAILLAGSVSFFIMLKRSESPEKTIIGQWKEQKWEYEKVNRVNGAAPLRPYTSEETRYLAAQNLVIHESEKWTFLPGGKLKLSGRNSERIVAWHIKGRGHVLELRYDDNETETYNLTRLNDRQMVLNFESDVQVRGIAKLTFEKVL